MSTSSGKVPFYFSFYHSFCLFTLYIIEPPVYLIIITRNTLSQNSCKPVRRKRKKNMYIAREQPYRDSNQHSTHDYLRERIGPRCQSTIHCVELIHLDHFSLTCTLFEACGAVFIMNSKMHSHLKSCYLATLKCTLTTHWMTLTADTQEIYTLKYCQLVYLPRRAIYAMRALHARQIINSFHGPYGPHLARIIIIIIVITIIFLRF